MLRAIPLVFLVFIGLIEITFAQSPVGKWEIQPAGVVMHLNSDGTGTMNSEPFRWKISEGALIIEENSGVYYYQYSSTQDALTVSDLATGLTLSFTKATDNKAEEGNPAPLKQKADPGSSSSGTAALIGKWCYMSNVTSSDGGRMSNECITFYENGTFEYYTESASSGSSGGYASQSSDKGTWTVSESTIQVESNSNGPASYSYLKQNHPKNGDPMLIIDGRAFVTYYNKSPW